MKRLLWLVLAILLCSCVSVRYIYHFPANVATEVVAVHVDKTFSEQDKIWIDQAVSEWNKSLNGYMRLEVVSREFDMMPNEMKESGVFILKIRSGNDMLQERTPRVVGFTNIGGKWIWIVRDRIYGADIVGVVMHEIGHAVLKVNHLGESSLMYKYDAGHSSCVDEETVREVARINHWDPSHMIWCSTNAL